MAVVLAGLIFVYVGLAASGGTVPFQALPSAFQWLAEIEPLRQVLAGTRAILYFDAQANAGLTRAVTTAALGLVFWLVVGTVVVRWYDRKGFRRLSPELLAYVGRSAQRYHAQKPILARTPELQASRPSRAPRSEPFRTGCGEDPARLN